MSDFEADGRVERGVRHSKVKFRISGHVVNKCTDQSELELHFHEHLFAFLDR